MNNHDLIPSTHSSLKANNSNVNNSEKYSMRLQESNLHNSKNNISNKPSKSNKSKPNIPNSKESEQNDFPYFKIATFNVQNKSYEELKSLVYELLKNKPDLIALQQCTFVDGKTSITSFAKKLSKKLNYFLVFGDGISSTFGNVILSRYKIEEARNTQIIGESRLYSLLRARINIPISLIMHEHSEKKRKLALLQASKEQSYTMNRRRSFIIKSNPDSYLKPEIKSETMIEVKLDINTNIENKNTQNENHNQENKKIDPIELVHDYSTYINASPLRNESKINTMEMNQSNPSYHHLPPGRKSPPFSSIHQYNLISNTFQSQNEEKILSSQSEVSKILMMNRIQSPSSPTQSLNSSTIQSPHLSPIQKDSNSSPSKYTPPTSSLSTFQDKTPTSKSIKYWSTGGNHFTIDIYTLDLSEGEVFPSTHIVQMMKQMEAQSKEMPFIVCGDFFSLSREDYTKKYFIKMRNSWKYLYNSPRVDLYYLFKHCGYLDCFKFCHQKDWSSFMNENGSTCKQNGVSYRRDFIWLDSLLSSLNQPLKLISCDHHNIENTSRKLVICSFEIIG